MLMYMIKEVQIIDEGSWSYPWGTSMGLKVGINGKNGKYLFFHKKNQEMGKEMTRLLGES